jgi:hypothetical protein
MLLVLLALGIHNNRKVPDLQHFVPVQLFESFDIRRRNLEIVHSSATVLPKFHSFVVVADKFFVFGMM